MIEGLKQAQCVLNVSGSASQALVNSVIFKRPPIPSCPPQSITDSNSAVPHPIAELTLAASHHYLTSPVACLLYISLVLCILRDLAYGQRLHCNHSSGHCGNRVRISGEANVLCITGCFDATGLYEKSHC
jgi:hypothetical protein